MFRHICRDSGAHLLIDAKQAHAISRSSPVTSRFGGLRCATRRTHRDIVSVMGCRVHPKRSRTNLSVRLNARSN